MTRRNILQIICISAFLLGVLPVRRARGQVPEQTPASLVRFLMYESRQPKNPMTDIGASCGIDEDGREDRKAVKALVEMENRAVPALEQAFKSMEAGEKYLVPNAHWLFYAYAKIRGPVSFPRLWKMAGNPNLEKLQLTLDDSIALALDLTSYVSSYRNLVRVFRCRVKQPRDGLDQLILAWEKDDRLWLETTLGPKARRALDSLLRETTWEDMRKKIWPTQSKTDVGVGYRFDISHIWSEPQAFLEDYRDVSESEPAIDTRFMGRSGGACGHVRLKFVKAVASVPPGYQAYLVNNSNLEELLHLISACAAMP